MICLIHGRPACRALCGLVTKFPARHGTREIERGTMRPIEMKRCTNLPYHKVLKLITPHFEVSPKVVHDSNVISEGLGRRETGKPTTLLAFWEVNPPTCRDRGGHRFWGASGGGGDSSCGLEWRRQDVGQTGAFLPDLSSKTIECAYAHSKMIVSSSRLWTSSRRESSGRTPAI